ncbi:MAG: hypothetical protein CBC02_009910 [Flavobacteriaceae bacterium TMED42]|nr:MAG: hypothetical protein CBC02_009910 [Flavobacteriaceae bacterium TMED42]
MICMFRKTHLVVQYQLCFLNNKQLRLYEKESFSFANLIRFRKKYTYPSAEHLFFYSILVLCKKLNRVQLKYNLIQTKVQILSYQTNNS